MNIFIKNLLLTLSLCLAPVSSYCLNPKLGLQRENERRAIEQLIEVVGEEQAELRIDREARQLMRGPIERFYATQSGTPQEDIEADITRALNNTRRNAGGFVLFQMASSNALERFRQEEQQTQDRTELNAHDNDNKRQRRD